MTVEARVHAAVFVGAVHEALPALQALLESDVECRLVVTLDPDAASRVSGFVDLEPLARAHGVPVLKVRDINDGEVIARIAAEDPDLGVVVGWTRLLHEPVLAVPRHGWVGFYASLLPHNRGRAPVNWAIIHGETVTGNTMMLLSPGTDTGDIVDQRLVPIRFADTCASVYVGVALAGAEMLREHLPALVRGCARRHLQAHVDTALLPKRTPDMGITDWTRSARALYDWVRALGRPYPGAYTTVDGARVTIWAADRPSDLEAAAEPGLLLSTDGDGVWIATGDGMLRLLEVDAGAGPEGAAQWLEREGLQGRRCAPVNRATALWALGQGPHVTPPTQRTPTDEAVVATSVAVTP